MSKKVAVLSGLLATLTMAGQAQAESKRYLVHFKTPKTFHSVARVASAQRMLAPGVMAPMRLFNSDAVVADSLNNVEMLVVQSDNDAAARSLGQHSAVAFVEEEIFHPAPQIMATLSNEALNSILPSKIDQPWGIGAVKAPAAWAVTRGEGARVMVLDTGLDASHPAVAARLEKGQNFTDSDKNDFSDKIGHGTHVAATVLASGDNQGLVGVAPKARLLSGKVCSDRGCSSIAISSGINWAVGEHVDVVNMSLGGAFLSAGEAVALDHAETAGVTIVAASGNDGTSTVGYPAAVDTVIAVGAVDSTLAKAQFSQWGPELDVVAPGVDVYSAVPRGTGRAARVRLPNLAGQLAEVKSLPMQGSPVADLPNASVAYVGLGKPEDFRTTDVRGRVALISRGEIPFKDKVAAAIQAGAVGVIIFNNAPGLVQGTLSEDGSQVAVPVAMIEQTSGETLRDVLVQKAASTVSLSVERTDYASLQGTSMATPHVTGVVALIKSANPRLTPAQVRSILAETSTPLTPNDENQLGRGLVNAEAAVNKALQLAASGLRQVVD